MSILLHKGRLIDPATGRDGLFDILIEEGRVAKVCPPGQVRGARVLPVEGKYILPGLIDLHVHLREPGETHKEDIQSGSRAAVAGGFSAVCAMANTKPPNDSPEVTALIKERAQSALCRVYPVGAVSKNLSGQELTSFASLKQAGCVALSDDGRPIASAELMRRALLEAAALDLVISVHEEDPSLAGEWAMHEGEISLRLGLPGLPAEAEEVMVARDLLLASRTGGRLHIAHVSTARSVEMIREAKRRGVPVTAEVTPHHLHLTDAACLEYDPNTKMAPPLRCESDVLALRAGLADGTIDAVATDHAPHSPLEKDCEFAAAANGVIGLETALPLVLDLVRAGDLSLTRAVEALTSAPARCFGLPGGSLAEGVPADLTVVDPERPFFIKEGDFRSKSQNSPFLQRNLQGRAILTMVAGKIVFDLDGMAG